MRDIANYRISAFMLHTFLFNNLLTLSLPATSCAGHNTDLSSNRNISKTVKVNIVFIESVLKSI